jgi:hypothetical protein
VPSAFSKYLWIERNGKNKRRKERGTRRKGERKEMFEE